MLTPTTAAMREGLEDYYKSIADSMEVDLDDALIRAINASSKFEYLKMTTDIDKLKRAYLHFKDLEWSRAQDVFNLSVRESEGKRLLKMAKIISLASDDELDKIIENLSKN